MQRSNLSSLLAQQQAQHESRIRDLLEAQQRQLLEALRTEISRVVDTTKVTEIRRPPTPTLPTPVSSKIGQSRKLVDDENRSETKEPGLQSQSLLQNKSAKSVKSMSRATDSEPGSHWTMQDQAAVYEAHMQMKEAALLKHSFCAAAGRLIQHSMFEALVCLLVALNAASIGAHADWTMKNLGTGEGEPEAFRILDAVFAALFFVELILRIAGEGWRFLAQSNRNRPWNILDVVLVSAGAVEEALALFLISSPNVTIMRLIRTLRAVRVVRVFRVTRFFTDLRLMVMGLMSAARSLFWVILLLVFVMYIFAVGIMEITADSMADYTAVGVNGTSTDEVLDYVGSLDATMYTLYKGVLGGLDWGEVSDLLAKKSAVLIVLFCTYIAFSTLCILNIVTGLFVQNASSVAHEDQIEMGLEHLERRRAWLHEVIELFKLGDVEGTGRLNWAKFKRCVMKPSVQAYFHKLGIDLESINARGLFCLFDFNNDGTIDLEEFARGIMKLHGAARSFDLQVVGNDTKRILRKVQAMER